MTNDLNTITIHQIFDHLAEAQKKLKHLATNDILLNLSRLQKMWHEDGGYFQRALALTTGHFSPLVAKMALKSLAYNLNETVLRQALINELGVVPSTHATQISPDYYIHIQPLGVITQILPGNNFINGLMAIIHSLLTKNAVLLKPSHNEIGIINLFMKSFEEANVSPTLRNCVAVINISHHDKHDKEGIAIIKQRSDGLIVWGGSEAIKAFPQHECKGKVHHFGPKLGIGVIDNLVDLKISANHFAWDISLFEQRACSSPRLILVKDKGDHKRLHHFAQLLDQEILALTKNKLPAPCLSFDMGAEILLHRERAFFEGGELIGSETDLTHSVFVMTQRPSHLAEGYRIVYLLPYNDSSDLEEILTSYRNKGYLQTATVDLHETNWDSLSTTLFTMGIDQILKSGVNIPGELGLPHEGKFMMQHLVRHCFINKRIGFFSNYFSVENNSK